MSISVDFLNIGVPRAGTTWLWQVLKQHPGVWMPPIKELHYFDRSLIYPFSNYLAEDRLFHRLLGREKHNRQFRKLMRGWYHQVMTSPDKRKSLGWFNKFFLGTYDDAWYLSLFETKKAAVKGECTPSYAALSVKDIRRIHTLLPHLKVILILRDPVERAWSHLRLLWTIRPFDINDESSVLRRLERPQLQYHYVDIVQNWSTIFPREQFFIGFFNDLSLHTERFAQDIFTLLNLDASHPITSDLLQAHINTAREETIPTRIEQLLAEKYLPEAKQLVPLVGKYSEDWLRRIESVLR